MEFKYGNEPAGYMKYGEQGPVNDTSDLGPSRSQNIEEPIIHPGELGQSVTEGSRFGNFIQTVTGAIRTGASKVELQAQMGGGAEAVGTESYGKESKQALRELAAINEVQLTSVHVPTQVGNVSGFNPQQGFVDEQRKSSVDEIKKAIDFASDVTGGGTITFHTGEYQRPISEQPWAKIKDSSGNPVVDSQGNEQYMFLGYEEEPGKAVTYMVDDRNGKILSDIRKSNVIREPVYRVSNEDNPHGIDVDGKSRYIYKGDYVDLEGRYINPENPDHLFHRVADWDKDLSRFRTRKLAWDEIKERAKERNDRNNYWGTEKEITPEMMAYRIQVENQIMQAKGHSLFYARQYEGEIKRAEALRKALKNYEELEKKIPKEDIWKLMKDDPALRQTLAHEFIAGEQRLPSEIIKDSLRSTMQDLQHIHEASSAADAQADTLKDTLEHVVPIDNFAKERSFMSIAEVGIHAMEKTIQGKREGTVNRDIILTPENIFPEMGYGSHPEELKELVLKSRDKMVELLSEKKITDPHQRIKLETDPKTGEVKEVFKKIDNPYYKGMSKDEAKRFAENHIKANLDTQHLGMWGKHFQAKYLKDQSRLETPEETKARFMNWYNDQVKMLADEGIIGEVHIVDGYASGGHTHLPAGQGELPVVDAVKYLREKGFKGVLISEGHGEESWGPGRIMTKAWEAFGSQVFSSGYFGQGGGGGFGAPIRWTDINNSYFQKKQGPYFVFGGYSPSNDWTLWSEVPLE
jgi:hypothetical protein